MVNLTDQNGFTHPMWNSGGERVQVFKTRDEAIEAADAYLRIWHTVPLDAKPEGFGWERLPESGPLDNAVRAIGRFMWQEDRWQAVVFKMEEQEKAPLLTKTAFHALRECIIRIDREGPHKAQAIELVNALEAAYSA